MSKKAVSLTLDEANLLWLQGVAARSGARSLSEAVDRLIATARKDGTTQAPRSVVGTIDIDQTDPLLEDADRIVRAPFERSLARPFLVRESRARVETRSSRKSRRG